ncbi:MAG: DNA methyltransferase [Acetobacteraceae bacterium]
MRNTLFFGDNLDVLRGRDADGRALIPDESVDLIYLDPPFNSAATYNVLFKAPDGGAADSQIEAFEDSWHWGDSAARAFQDVVTGRHGRAATLLRAMRDALGENDMMAYLAMMAARLVELHRVLKPTGSLYLHCDPTASHYLKVLLDGIFGAEKFYSELVWKRSHAHNSARRWGPIHDTILFYAKSEKYVWNQQRQPYAQDYVDRYFKFDDQDGRGRYWTGDLTGAGVRNGPSGEPWRGHDVRAIGRHWAYAPEQLDALDADRRIYWPKAPGAMPKLKRYLAEARGIPAQSVLDDIPSLQRMSAAHAERLGSPPKSPSRFWKESSPPRPIPAMWCWTRSAAVARRCMPPKSSGGGGSGLM